jgi:retinol dehydrogenase 12
VSYSLHPGVVASDIWRRVPGPVRPLVTRRMLTVQQGARTSLYCATAPEAVLRSGAYYEDCAEKQPSRVATRELGEQLWLQSETWTNGR